MSHAYRSAYQHIVGMRLAKMQLAWETVEPLLPRLRAVGEARIARIVAGGVGLVGAAAVALLACIGDEEAPTYALVGSGVAAMLTLVFARGLLALGGRLGRRSPVMPKLTGELEGDLARIEASDPLPAIHRRLDALEVWSTALPLAALSLLMPLCLHYAVAAMAWSQSAEGFARWIRISLAIVGHAHLALLALAIRFARKLKRSDSEDLGQMAIAREWLKAWGITVGVSAVPGVLFLAVPPIITAATGIAFIPFMFTCMRRRVMSERATMELAEETVHVRVSADDAPAALEESAWCEPASAEPEGDHRHATSARI